MRMSDRPRHARASNVWALWDAIQARTRRHRYLDAVNRFLLKLLKLFEQFGDGGGGQRHGFATFRWCSILRPPVAQQCEPAPAASTLLKLLVTSSGCETAACCAIGRRRNWQLGVSRPAGHKTLNLWALSHADETRILIAIQSAPLTTTRSPSLRAER